MQTRSIQTRLLISVLLLCLPVCALGGVANYDSYTAAHKARTCKFLKALIASYPLLEDFTLGTSHHWSYVDSAMMGVRFYPGVISAADLLPAVPPDVPGSSNHLTSTGSQRAE
ncbi:hypothetical protein LDHU3_31.2550:CDS1 [Leishmania donovani]|uniref:Hypothetical_protein n=2 Tax=Leishmania donovani species complex TaxID=38574 RepID=A0A6L0XVV8_LEIIN|nr:hypothetical protein CGC20_3400 [Leishmania donovani]CAC9519258.1 hypothetical_protein [Leishmania infantum]CAJ1991339.1 hypothetical protein LDHU3_31.2550:CDS1 [Leishmania donovani]SUZ44365.1 hypothetical_protein [Leishmania infantum]VDZ47185.1 hypothetical_protein [Leishmania donovani]